VPQGYQIIDLCDLEGEGKEEDEGIQCHCLKEYVGSWLLLEGLVEEVWFDEGQTRWIVTAMLSG
jgi:hypothetical protein